MPPTPSSVDASHSKVTESPCVYVGSVTWLGRVGAELSWIEETGGDQEDSWEKPSWALTR